MKGIDNSCRIGQVPLIIGPRPADTEPVAPSFPPTRRGRPVRFGLRAQGTATTRAGRVRERGITIVEAAFVTPVFFMMVLGLIEIGLYMNDYLAASNTVRAAARTASASGNDMYADYYVAQAIQDESSAIPLSQIQYVVVYKADGFGSPPTTACKAGTRTSGVCNVYSAADLVKVKSRWGCIAAEALDNAWCPTTRKTSSTGTGTEYVGIYIKITHPWVTKMFGSQKDITDTSVIRLEPQTFG